MALHPFKPLKPDNKDAFETFCLKVFSVDLQLPHLQRFARSGQPQFGIDLFSSTSDGVVGIQCKLRNSDPGLTLKELEKAIELAKTFTPSLRKFILATTSARDPKLQQAVILADQIHRSQGLFEVAMYSWDDIEELFKQHSELVSDIYPIPSQSVSIPNPTYTHIAPLTGGGTAGAEIDKAADFIAAGQADTGLVLLENMQRDRWNHLTDREKYRLLANKGNGLLQKQDAKGAARAFFEAVPYASKADGEADAITAHAELLLGNLEKAYSLAVMSCSRNPLSERAQIVRIHSAPSETKYEDLRDSVPEILLSRLNISLTLADRAFRDEKPAEAERALRLAAETSPQRTLLLGSAVLQQSIEAGILLPPSEARLREAQDILSKAIASDHAPTDLIATAYYNRGLASVYLNEEHLAFSDFRAAHEKEPSKREFGKAFIVAALKRGDTGSALKIGRSLVQDSPTPDVRLLLSSALSDSGGESERQEALQVLRDGLTSLHEAEPRIRLEYLKRIIDILKLLEALTSAALEDLIAHLPSALERAIITSHALVRMDRPADAKEAVQQSVELLEGQSDSALRREVALLLTRLELHLEALPLWLGLSSPQSVSEDTGYLLRCAKELGRDDVILEHCAALRQNGIFAPQVAVDEVRLLLQYNEIRRAKTVLQGYLDANSNDPSLRWALLNLAVVEDWSEVVASWMPADTKVEPPQTAIDGARLVQILGFTGRRQAAAELAYELVRRFPDDPHSHRALINSVLGVETPKSDLDLGAPAEVRDGTAVRIRHTGATAPTWIVIETSAGPQVSRDEYAPTHQLAKALIGKKVGEEVSLPLGFVRSQTATIEEIKNRVLFRMHQSMEFMNQRFPEMSFFELVSMGPSEDSPGGLRFDELLDVQRTLAKGPMEAERLYKERRVPFASLAIMGHKRIPDILENFASNDMTVIHCVDGRAEEFQEARRVIGSAREMVLDLTALGTLRLLSPSFDLKMLAAECIASEGSLNQLKQAGRRVGDDGRVAGFMGFDGERIVIQPFDPETERLRADKARVFAELIEARCTIVGGQALSRVDAERRKVLLNLFGAETAESIAIAIERECPMWTDDYITAVLLKSEFGVPRVWTQVVSIWLRDAEAMTNEECDVIAARLCGFNYEFTSISWKTVVAACALSDWSPTRQPLAGVLRRLEEYGKTQDTLMMAAGVIPTIWRHAPHRDDATRVTLRVLEIVAASQNGLAVIKAVRQEIDTLFGVNVVGAKQAEEVIVAWLHAARNGGRIFPP